MIKTRKYVAPSIVFALLAILFVACGKVADEGKNMPSPDSIIHKAYISHQYDSLISLADSLQAAGGLSDQKAFYWKGYAYYKQQKMKLAERMWERAYQIGCDDNDDISFYIKTANRLAALCTLRGEYGRAANVAVPALQKMEASEADINIDYAYLLTTMGCVQLKTATKEQAIGYFQKSYDSFCSILDNDSSSITFHAAIASLITATNNYNQTLLYKEAKLWTEYTEQLLDRYCSQYSDSVYADKQLSRLLLYRATALEGLGKKAEAARTFERAMKNSYSKTTDGYFEAARYLMVAKRWQEAADSYDYLEQVLDKYDMRPTLDNIERLMMPRFKANVGAQRHEKALEEAIQISNMLDSAIAVRNSDDAAELAIIYSTQQKETELAKEQAAMTRQKAFFGFFAMLIVIVLLATFILQRQRAGKKLQDAYDKLAVANEKAEESSKMKTAFIQQMSHEIRTPLNLLTGFAQVLTTPGMELDEETSKEINSKMLENTARITGLVDKMLDLSDATSTTVLERKDTPMAVEIAAYAVEMSGVERATHIEFVMDTGGDAPETMLTTDTQQASRALSLVLHNAAKFTKDGKVKLFIDKQADTLRFVVEDTGIGVPAEEAEHIFEEFVQLNDYMEGTGIGLTVARSICRRLGGDVVLDTSYTQGARFVMTLPLA